MDRLTWTNCMWLCSRLFHLELKVSRDACKTSELTQLHTHLFEVRDGSAIATQQCAKVLLMKQCDEATECVHKHGVPRAARPILCALNASGLPAIPAVSGWLAAQLLCICLAPEQAGGRSRTLLLQLQQCRSFCHTCQPLGCCSLVPVKLTGTLSRQTSSLVPVKAKHY